LETGEWTPENGLLTPSYKPRRMGLKNKYKQQFSEIYNKKSQQTEKKENKKESLEDLIFRILGIEKNENFLQKTVQEVGIDSISTVILIYIFYFF
jgi:K+/H+ antiporter YhaU regulatory subunit KhtT